jgi:phospholipase/carboxylesterase
VLALGLGSRRNGLLYVPEGYKIKPPAPLALTQHGAGGNARSEISHFLNLADEPGLILPAAESRGRPWDVLVGGYGKDVEFIDQALKQMFDCLPVDARGLAVTGFSEGASYVPSVGLPDGDLFAHVIAFSTAFASPAAYRGKPPVFVSHGTRDEVLPIDRCSRRSSP